jgi:ariadne-1
MTWEKLTLLFETIQNGGCMHMTCRKNSGGCGHEFCWLCRGPWSEHGSETGGYYACNKYNASNAKDEDIQSEQVKTELEAYMFYYHRFDSHRNAMKVADDQKRNADNKASEILSKYSVRSQDTKFLREAIEQILDVRYWWPSSMLAPLICSIRTAEFCNGPMFMDST